MYPLLSSFDRLFRTGMARRMHLKRDCKSSLMMPKRQGHHLGVNPWGSASVLTLRGIRRMTLSTPLTRGDAGLTR
jgi:hypothetical protein